jgi:exosome complex RNA-binding protein Rrp4
MSKLGSIVTILLERARNIMKRSINKKKRSEREYQVGDMVYVNIQPLDSSTLHSEKIAS